MIVDKLRLAATAEILGGKLLLLCHFYTRNPTMSGLRMNLGLWGQNLSANCQVHDMVSCHVSEKFFFCFPQEGIVLESLFLS